MVQPPLYSKNVKTNVVRKFSQLIDKHFSKSCHLNTIFNRNNIKVSYSCMRNVKTSISNHNHQLLKQRAENPTSIGSPGTRCLLFFLSMGRVCDYNYIHVPSIKKSKHRVPRLPMLQTSTVASAGSG